MSPDFVPHMAAHRRPSQMDLCEFEDNLDF